MQDPVRSLREALAFQAELAGPLVPQGRQVDTPQGSHMDTKRQPEARAMHPPNPTEATGLRDASPMPTAEQSANHAQALDASPMPTAEQSANHVQALDASPMPTAEQSTNQVHSLNASPQPPATDHQPPDMNQDLFGNAVDPLKDPSLSAYDRIKSLIAEGSPLHDMDTLEQVADYVANTVLIPLDEHRINPVFGVGNPDANLMVIGEAPGADEDRKGEPFVGRAGQLLTKILEAINFKREDVYIANILKSRPPNNRDPLPAEVEAHFPLLLKQIILIQPRLILCVGKTAGCNLLNKKTSLGALRGTFHDFHGIPTMVTYHPAALLRNPQWKRPTWEDVQLLRTRYDQLTA